MSLGILGMFGLVPFTCSGNAVQTFKDVQINHEARYAVHDVIGNAPVPEYIGPGQRKITFNMQLRSQFGSPPAVVIELLKQMLDSGESYRLCLGPEYLGKFYLRSFSEQRKYFDGAGVAIATDVSLSIEEDQGFNIVTSFLDMVRRIFS